MVRRRRLEENENGFDDNVYGNHRGNDSEKKEKKVSKATENHKIYAKLN